MNVKSIFNTNKKAVVGARDPVNTLLTELFMVGLQPLGQCEHSIFTPTNADFKIQAFQLKVFSSIDCWRERENISFDFFLSL